ncbi:hypothetical protein DPMN_030817 [Dreissena polymorpha]|uniref:Uncharacterized protein n=1 Tax=Dreissena polymorpha TaxID=45954 RepID=A0A9D4M0P1_DREPO|nr:hypothetical protein DPMN_030817 [Dreissena polymorpha]
MLKGHEDAVWSDHVRGLVDLRVAVRELKLLLVLYRLQLSINLNANRHGLVHCEGLKTSPGPPPTAAPHKPGYK